jgi:hypothetical protein
LHDMDIGNYWGGGVSKTSCSRAKKPNFQKNDEPKQPIVFLYAQ